MNIKRKTGLMMFVAALLAIIGIASVSFAAWAGGYRTATASAATGSAYFFGFEEKPSNVSFDALVPYDQPDATIETGVKISTKDIPEFTALNEEYTVTVSTASALKFYVLIDEKPADNSEVAVPADPAADAAWKLVTAGTDAEFTFGGENQAGAQNLRISLILVSNDKADQNKTDIAFNVTLASPSAGEATPEA